MHSWKRCVCLVCMVLLVVGSTAAAAPLERLAVAESNTLFGQRVPWGPDVDLENDLGWAQFALGPVGNGQRFEVELTISNTDPENFYLGELLLADSDLSPIEGIEFLSLDPITNQVTGVSPQLFGSLPFSVGALGTVKWRIAAPAALTSVLVGFLLLHAGIGSNSQLVTTFAYVLLNASGLVIDRIPVLPLLAASLFQFTYTRLDGLSTGIAVAVLVTTLVQLTVFFQGGFSPQGGGEFTTLIEMAPGQRTFFPEEEIPELPTTIPGALVTVEFLPGGPVGSGGIGVPPMGWVAALDVTSPPLSETIQIAGKEVRRGANQLLFSLQDRAGVAVRR